MSLDEIGELCCLPPKNIFVPSGNGEFSRIFNQPVCLSFEKFPKRTSSAPVVAQDVVPCKKEVHLITAGHPPLGNSLYFSVNRIILK